MELYKEKEIFENKTLSMDPDNGIEIEIENINLELTDPKNPLNSMDSLYKYHAKSKSKDVKSDFYELEENFKHPYIEKEDLIELSEIPEDFEEVLVSLDEFISHLDDSEELIDV